MRYLILIAILLLQSPAIAEDSYEDNGYYIEVEATAYTASVEECGKSDGITASGEVAQEGITIAADDLPLGTIVEINGQRYVVQDRFGGNYRNRVDIYMEDVSRATQFGRQRLMIKILEEGEADS